LNVNRTGIRGIAPQSLAKHAILAARRRERMRQAPRSRAFSRAIRGLVLLFVLLLPLPNRAHSDLVIVPFHTVQTFILVQAKVNGNPATLLLDTGANRTIVSTRIYGNTQVNLQRIHQNDRGPGLAGESLRLRADVVLANHMWVAQPVSVMNLDDLKHDLGINFDGLLGEDLLREFHSVRINYKAHVIELEQ
jgi:hypothetical protein